MKQPNLKTLRTKHKLSIIRAAKLAGISPDTWWRAESGKRPRGMMPDTIKKITNAFKALKQG